jgi:hypothetical protein
VEVTNTMGAAELVRKYLESDAGSDLLAEMVKMAAELLMDADVARDWYLVGGRVKDLTAGPRVRHPSFPSSP